MEEVLDKTRKVRKILFSAKHFWEEVINDDLFSSLEKAEKITIKAIRNFGVLIEPMFPREDCKYLCVFRSDLNKIICCPIRLVGRNTFFVPTIFPANGWQKDAFKKIIKRRKLKK